MIRVDVSVCSHSAGPIGGLADQLPGICGLELLFYIWPVDASAAGSRQV